MDKVRMLVVEDERIVSMDLQRRLKAMGYEIAGAAVSGEEAIEKAESLRPDMVLMDIMLDGELDGTQAAEIIRARFSIPVIYLTAYADSATLERAKITEPFGYILKPFEERELHGHIEIALYKARMEKKLKDSEERYVLATMGANDGLWDWDLKTHTIYFSPRWKAMLGYDDSEIGHHPREWFSRLHPEDRPRVKQHIAAHITGKAKNFESEYRILCKDGTYRWALTRGLALVDANGKAQRIAGSQTDITERKLYEPLTGLPNRILFSDRIQSTLERGRSGFAVLSIKLADFKDVADGLNGDREELFLQVAQRIKEALREGDTLAHIGEETLGALLVDVRDPSEANALAARVLEFLNRPFSVDVQRIYFQSCVGIACSGGYFNSEDLLRDAATAMSRACLAGRSQIELFDEKMRQRVAVRVQKESDLRRAIEREEFQVYYQPIVSLDSGKLAGFEALVRWAHRDGLRLPGEFIPLAEDTGLIIPIERFVLQNAVKQMREWATRLKLGPGITMSVNLSPQHYSEPDLVEEIKRLLKSTGFDPSLLKLEITESALMRDTDVVSKTLAQLDDLNIKLAMDDFGTGYSSLSALHQFPIKTLKIDRCFVSNLGRRSESRKIVQAIVALGKNLGMDVTAEGVENQRQIVELQAFDCSHAQGFLFSRPMSREQAGRLLIERQQWFTDDDEIVEDDLLVR
ncbi:MAG TPA: EAL domain-containing protein [Terriglobia bacterium]|nr:EAL domain-containing protein [Terriglobia bacterium]